MFTKADIIAMTNRIVRRQKGIAEPRIIHPYREWYIALSVSMLVAFVGIGYNAYLFRYYHAIEQHTVPSEATEVEYDVDMVKEVVALYQVRAQQFISAQENVALSAETVEVSVATTTEGGDSVDEEDSVE